MPSRIFIKLLLTLLGTLAATVLLILLVINWSFQQGFIDYLEQGEIDKAEAVAMLFAEHYREEGDWYFMEENYHVWGKTMRAAGVQLPGRPGRRPPPREARPYPSRQAPNSGNPDAPSPLDHEAYPNNVTAPQGRLPPPPNFRQASGPASAPPPARRPPPGPNTIATGADGVQTGPALGYRLTLYNLEKQPILFRKPKEKIKHWIPIVVATETVGWVGLEGFKLETDQLATSFLQQQRKNERLIGAAVLLLSLLVATILARQFLRPIHKVAFGAKRVAAGDYTHQIQVEGKDELAQLAQDFNKMTSTLKRTEGLRKQWISDISHELRTPIAVLSGEIEALLDGIRQPTPERINSLYQDVQGLGRLVEDLHQLSLADQGVLELSCSHIDLYNIASNLVIPFTPRLEEKGLKLNFVADRTQDLTAFGDARRLTQLLINLLENSLRYTDSGGATTIRLTPQSDANSLNKEQQDNEREEKTQAGKKQQSYVRVEVEDTTPGVPDESLPKIFDRLYRVDKSRSRSVGGSGLGLSICKNIVEAHGGTIYAEHSQGGGLKISFLLPQNASAQ